MASVEDERLATRHDIEHNVSVDGITYSIVKSKADLRKIVDFFYQHFLKGMYCTVLPIVVVRVFGLATPESILLAIFWESERNRILS
jgi:hypothetical protein